MLDGFIEISSRCNERGGLLGLRILSRLVSTMVNFLVLDAFGMVQLWR